MARKQRPTGKCRLCGVLGPLSWEHVPPKAAFNKYPVVRATIEQMLTPGEWDGTSGTVQQRGSGAYTLCEKCNNNTGTWYGTEYAEWAKQGLERLLRVPHEDCDHLAVSFRGRPLRFLKQVITMSFSANGESFADIHPELVRFVLDWQAVGLPAEYRVDLVLLHPGP